MLEIGDRIPVFSLRATDGSTVKSSAFKGNKTIIYFYPKDNTPGCTKQACSLRDGWARLKKNGVGVYGISPDTVESHRTFTEQYDLPFPLLADPDHKIAERFGVWVEKNMYGKKSMGIKRTTFVVDEAGKIMDVIKKVDTADHANQLLERLSKAAIQ